MLCLKRDLLRRKAAIILLGVFVGLSYRILISRGNFSNTQFYLPTYTGQHNTLSKRDVMTAKLQFITDWTEFVNSRTNFTRIHNGCNMTWKKQNAIPWMKKLGRTCPDKSFISIWNINPAGEFSRVVLQTQYTNGSIKLYGGDYWRAYVRGSSSVPVLKTDLGNGSYEFKFFPLVSGSYRLDISLEYTLCDGIKEPPDDWFIKGNVQGKEQKHGILFHDMPYINKTLWSGTEINFYVPSKRLSAKETSFLMEEMCTADETSSCKYLWNGFGGWLNKTTWQPLCFGAAIPRYPRHKEGILWIFGDSVSSQFYHSIKRNRICKLIFKNCMYSYNWIYSLENYNLTLGRYVRRNSTMEKKLWNDLDFDIGKVIKELQQAVLNPSMDSKSAILLNYGLHFTEATNFTNFKKLIKEVVNLKDQIKCKIIWRTTTSLNRHKYSMPNLHSRRFMTSQRVQLYNAYATNEFCKAGIDVLDIYPLTDSYPFGTGSARSRTDPVHYEYHVMRPMEVQLERVFQPL